MSSYDHAVAVVDRRDRLAAVITDVAATVNSPLS